MGVRAVFLVGFMASGKSCVGQELARRLDWDFVVWMPESSPASGKPFPRFFGTEGSPGFGSPKAARFAICCPSR